MRAELISSKLWLGNGLSAGIYCRGLKTIIFGIGANRLQGADVRLL